MVDPLEGKPRGQCPECGEYVFDTPREGGSYHPRIRKLCNWSEELTQDQNRIRYAADKLEESKLWNKIEKEGGER
jgi:hypothetical protein